MQEALGLVVPGSATPLVIELFIKNQRVIK